MKFFRDKPLSTQAAYLLVLLAVVLVAEFAYLHYRINRLNELHASADFARKGQVKSQQVALMLQRYTSGSVELSSDIIATIQDQDQALQVLENGGRIPDSDIIVSKVPRLPRISLDNLLAQWTVYKKHAYHAVGRKDLSDEIETSLTSTSDPYADLNTALLLDSQWKTMAKWYERLITDMDAEVANVRAGVSELMWAIVLINLVLGGIYYYLLRVKLLRPLRLITSNTGNHTHTRGLQANEIGTLATQVNLVIEQLKDATEFVESIGEGKLDLDYKDLEPEYQAGRNKLADSLIAMQGKLKTINEEDGKRKWANEGVNKFVEILRSSDNNIQKLGDRIISSLVQYTGANQGGLYILNDEDPGEKFLELVSLFAFDIKKFEKQRVKPGEGFLGQTFLERETTYLKELPQDYVRITSGLGSTNPSAVLIVPLKLDMEVYGVVELASFRQFQPHEISFVERLGETIASTLASVKAADRNHRLLEESKIATEAMRSQEEEMRQNMEELQATQEEMARKEKDYVAQIETLEAKVQGAVPEATLQQLRSQQQQKDEAHAARIRQLEARLKEAPPQEEWLAISDLEKTLRLHIDTLQITQEELSKKKKD